MEFNVKAMALLPSLIMLLIVSGCHKETSYDELPVPIEVGLHEVFHEQQRFFALSFSTVESYPCQNFEIAFEMDENPNGIDLNFQGLFVPHICVTAMGPARGFAKLKEMSERSFAVNFSYESNSLESFINISDDELVVTLQDTSEDFLYFPDKKINRLDSTFLWGYTKVISGKGAASYEKFIDELIAMGAWDPGLAEGHYGFFRMGPEGLQLNPYNNTPASSEEQTFVLCWENDFEEIQQIASNYVGVLEIQIFSSLGHDYNNQ